MPRCLAYDVPVDTGFFTPLHLQPTAVCRLAFNAAGRWLSTHAISHRRLVAEHRTGFVLWSVQLVCGDPVGFFDGDRLDVRVTGRVRGGGPPGGGDPAGRGPRGRATPGPACRLPPPPPARP